MEMRFDPVSAKMLHVKVNMEASDEHMGEIKIEIRVVKEHVKAMMNMLLFRALPKQVIIKLVYFTALWINSFPAKTVISKVYSPCEIIYGQKLDFRIHCRMDFGEYTEVYDEPLPINSMKSCTRVFLGLRPTGNLQGFYKFLGLTTGRKLKKKYWTPITMPGAIIKII